MQNNWYVLTGGPGSGKTTLIEELKKRGHNTVNESARHYIETQLAKGLSLEQIRENEQAFQEIVFKHKQGLHDSLSSKVVTFFDRGYHDTIAYLKYHQQEIPKFIHKACKDLTYQKVFVLDMLPYIKDQVRIEDQKTAHELHAALIKAYTDFGHKIIHVPPMPITHRADWLELQLSD